MYHLICSYNPCCGLLLLSRGHTNSCSPCDWLLLDGIVSHLKKQAGPASVAIQTQADFDKMVSGKDASVVGE